MKQFQRPRVDLYARRTFSENLSATFDFVSENFRTLFRFLTAFSCHSAQWVHCATCLP